MVEAQSADLQSTLNAILANTQSVRDDHKQLWEDNKRVQENLKSVHEDNKVLQENLKSVHEDNKILQENLKSVRDNKNQNKKYSLPYTSKQNKIKLSSKLQRAK